MAIFSSYMCYYIIVILTASSLILSRVVQKKVDLSKYEYLSNLLTIIDISFPVFFVFSLKPLLFGEDSSGLKYIGITILITLVFYKVLFSLLNVLIKKLR